MSAALRVAGWVVGVSLVTVAAMVVPSRSVPWWAATALGACATLVCGALAYVEGGTWGRRRTLVDEQARRTAFIGDLRRMLDQLPEHELNPALFRLYCQCKDDPKMADVMQLVEEYRPRVGTSHERDT